MSSRREAVGWRAAVVASALLGLAGCRGDGPKTHPIRGKVVLADGDVKQLAGGHVEFLREGDATVRADGMIGPDGSFAVQTQHKGRLLKGAPQGTYRARVILPEEYEGGAAKPRPYPVHGRFLDFKTSGLSFKVPAEGSITVTVSRR